MSLIPPEEKIEDTIKWPKCPKWDQVRSDNRSSFFVLIKDDQNGLSEATKELQKACPTSTSKKFFKIEKGQEFYRFDHAYEDLYVINSNNFAHLHFVDLNETQDFYSLQVWDVAPSIPSEI